MKTVGFSFLVLIFCVLFTGYMMAIFIHQLNQDRLEIEQENLLIKLDSLQKRSKQLQDSIQLKKNELIDASMKISCLEKELTMERTTNEVMHKNLAYLMIEKENLQERLISLDQILDHADEKINELTKANQDYAERSKSPIRSIIYWLFSFGVLLISRKGVSFRLSPNDDSQTT